MVCPPFTALCEVSRAMLNSNIRLGAQNMSENGFGAYTGEIAAGMLKEFSVRYVILGHSERRQFQKEPDALIAKKALAAHAATLKPIVCVGETLGGTGSGPDGEGPDHASARQPGGPEQGADGGRRSSPTNRFGRSGPAKTATSAQAQAAHAFIRKLVGSTVRRRSRAPCADSVRRQCQTVQCARVSPTRHGRRVGRGCEPQGGRLSGNCGGPGKHAPRALRGGTRQVWPWRGWPCPPGAGLQIEIGRPNGDHWKTIWGRSSQ